VVCAGSLDELQKVNIYIANLLELLKTNVELQDPQTVGKAMDLARASVALSPLLDLQDTQARDISSNSLINLATTTPTPSLPCTLKRLTPEEMADCYRAVHSRPQVQTFD